METIWIMIHKISVKNLIKIPDEKQQNNLQ